MLEVCDLEPWHIGAIERQPSQRVQLGLSIEKLDDAEAEALASERVTAAFLRDGVPIGVMGIAETYPGTQGVGWAIFAPGLGRDHLTITREARRRFAGSDLARIEAIAPCADVEPLLAAMPDIDPVALMKVLCGSYFATPEMRWAIMIGFRPVHVLRKYGAAAETHMLLERIASSSEAVGSQSGGIR